MATPRPRKIRSYIGPIDGHDLDTLVKTLSNLRDLRGPQLLHVITRKGHGYAKAEEDPILHRADRRPRSGHAGEDPVEPQGLARPATAARDHAQGPWLRQGRGRSDPVSRRHQVRSGGRHRSQAAG